MRHYFTDRNLRRAFVLVLFLGTLWFFRHLFLLFVFFVVFERTLGLCAGYLAAWTKLKFKWSLLLVIGMLLGTIAGGVWFGVATVQRHIPAIHDGFVTIADTIRHSELVARYRHLGAGVTLERVLETVQHHLGDAVQVAATVGREALYIFIALIFAIVFLLEREELVNFRERMPLESVPRVMLRYLGHVADAIAITLKLQVIVAIVSAVITIPVLIALDLPAIPALVAMLLVCGLVPVVGGVVAGAVLMTLAYVTKGPVGLVIFIVSTFVLHKIESYYLNPRLTARHVKLPSFVIIMSLVLFEHAFGLIGLFLSFPCLYVAAKIREGWLDPDDELRDEQERTAVMRGALPSLALKIRAARHKPESAPATGGGGTPATGGGGAAGGGE